MDRLRQVRSAALPTSKRTSEKDFNNEKTPIQQPPAKAPAKAPVDDSQRGRSDDWARRPSTKGGDTHHLEGHLNMDELDSKLEQHARISQHPQWSPPRYHRSPTDTLEDDSDCGPLEYVMSAESTIQGAEGVGSPHQHLPYQADEQGHSSDFQAFIREAEEDDRCGGPKEHAPPGRGREPALNLFYSNNWAARSEPPQKLSEIQESGDEDGGDSSRRYSSDSGEGTPPAAAASVSGGPSAPGWDTDAAGDFVAPRKPLPRAHTEPCGQAGSRRVQFSRGTSEAGERTGGRRGSGASCTQRLKSPARPVRRQRSMIKVISEYIRPQRD